MARIALSDGFSIIPEGTYVFEITSVSYKPDFGKLEITLSTEDGQTHIERYSLMRQDGSLNQGALNSFSYLAKTAFDDYSLEEIDHEDLVGLFIEAEVTHEKVPSNRDPNKTVTFTRLGDKFPSDGFRRESVDLDSLLG